MSESELMDTFLGLLESHIDPDLPKLPTSSSSRMTCLYNLRQNRDGMEGVDLVHVEFTQARLKPDTRKIPPSILEVAKKEFDRLITFYIFNCLQHHCCLKNNSPISASLWLFSNSQKVYHYKPWSTP